MIIPGATWQKGGVTTNVPLGYRMISYSTDDSVTIENTSAHRINMSCADTQYKSESLRMDGRSSCLTMVLGLPHRKAQCSLDKRVGRH